MLGQGSFKVRSHKEGFGLTGHTSMDDVAYSRDTVLYVGGLEEKVDEATLHGAFIPFGDIMAVEIPKDAATGKHRGFGFVAYNDPEDAQHALENMSESELYGRVLKCNIAKPNSIKNRAVWAEADKWYDKTLKADAKDVDSEVRAQQLQDNKQASASIGPAAPPGI